MTQSLLRSKAQVRADYLAARRQWQAQDPDAGARLVEHFPFDRVEVAGRMVAGYWPMGSEIDARPLMAAMALRGARLALPAVDGLDAPLVFRAYGLGDALLPGPLRTQAPGPAQPAVTPDILLMPLVAFDATGVRLGMGGGYYDRTAAALAAQGLRPLLIGLAFRAQALPDTPGLAMDPHDVRMDWVVTEHYAERFL